MIQLQEQNGRGRGVGGVKKVNSLECSKMMFKPFLGYVGVSQGSGEAVAGHPGSKKRQKLFDPKIHLTLFWP